MRSTELFEWSLWIGIIEYKDEAKMLWLRDRASARAKAGARAMLKEGGVALSRWRNAVWVKPLNRDNWPAKMPWASSWIWIRWFCWWFCQGRKGGWYHWWIMTIQASLDVNGSDRWWSDYVGLISDLTTLAWYQMRNHNICMLMMMTRITGWRILGQWSFQAR